MAKCTTAKDFFANQGGLTLPYSVYGKENQRKMAEKDPPFGRFDIFQTRPRRAAGGVENFQRGRTGGFPEGFERHF